MDSFGVRFSETKYIEVSMDFATGSSTVKVITEIDGEPQVLHGIIEWSD